MKRFFLDLFFPKHCFGCGNEGSYLCQDCEAVLEVFDVHRKNETDELDDIYFAVSYKKPLVRTLMQQFKSQPFVKDLSETLSSLMINHFKLTEKHKNEFKGFSIIPVPSNIKKLKWRGFNHSEEIAKHLAKYFEIPVINDVLMKDKGFHCANREKIKNKNIVLVDDFYITGATMKDCASVLKLNGANKVIGMAIAVEDKR